MYGIFANSDVKGGKNGKKEIYLFLPPKLIRQISGTFLKFGP